MIGRWFRVSCASLALLAGLASWVEAGREGSVPAASLGTRAAEALTILFVGETRGNLVPCNCPDGPWGGLARRVGYLAERRAAAAGPVLVLDTGGFLPVGAVPLRNDPRAEEGLVRLLVESQVRAGVDFLALEPGEGHYLQQLVPGPWRDLVFRTLDAQPPSAARTFSWHGTPVAVLALDENVDDATIVARVAEARRSAEVLIVLARADGVSGRRIAERTQADLVLLSYGVRTAEPVRVGRSWVVGAGREGKEIGELRLVRNAEGVGVEGFRLVPMDDAIAADEPTDGRVQSLLDAFGPGWRALVTPIE